MSNKWIKWAKDCQKRNEKGLTEDRKKKEIEDLIKWLKLFYKSNQKEKNLILLKLAKENEGLYHFIDNVKDLGEYDQERLYNQIRGNLV